MNETENYWDNEEEWKLPEYKYTDPIEKGFRKVRLTKEQHNRLFPKRPRTWQTHYDYYLSPERLDMHLTMSLPAKLITVATLPIALIWFGLENAKETFLDHTVHLFNEKKYGKFSSDTVFSSSDTYQQILEELNEV